MTSIPTTKTIEITVSPEGATSIKTQGFTGVHAGTQLGTSNGPSG